MSVTETPTGILTFLIADVRGYTSFTQAHGDEGAARLADKFAEIAREGVEAHGGEVTELRGDEALAVFSSPRAAVRAAIDLQMVFADETIVDPSLPLTVGIGIDAGEAVPVQGGYRGGALNLAARLCSKAVAGEVLVSQGIAHLTRAVEGIELIEAGQTEVKGLSAPVQIFRAHADRAQISLVAGPGELPSALDAVTPIVGRESESRRLRWLWRLARRGMPTTCVVLGPPGIGKTRLVAEVAATAAKAGGDCRYVSLATGRVNLATTTTLAVPGQRPQLIVLDDLETVSTAEAQAVAEQVSGITGSRLVVLVVEDESATTEVLTTARRLAVDDAHVVRPRPLTIEEMLRIAGFYVGTAVDAVPRDLLTTTGGVPRLVHETVSEWAQAYAARRLGNLATAAATGRSDLRTVESDLAGTVIDLQLVREQATLFGLGPGRRAPEPTESPYRGLASFDVDDADVFFGRERLVAELVSRLAGSNLLGVVGASGSGKSSAVRAGLVPALASGVLPASEDWTVAVLRPGEHPMRALDRALWSALPPTVTDDLGDGEPDLERVRAGLAAGERLLVVVDQFEEAFTLCRDEAERARFLAMLATTAAADDSRIAVVAAIRADYYGRCAADPLLAELLAANQVLVGPMTAEEYRRAIVQPALRVGAAIEPDLVDDLVAEVLGEPGALPLLSTTLLELWDHRDGRTLRRSSYVETGGVHGAVARLADDVYDSFDEHQQLVARSVLLRLAGPGIGDSVVRRRVPLAEFDVDRDETARGVVHVLATRRLVTVSDGSAEVAHEALLREWPRLQSWLEEDREGRRLRAHLAVAAQEWAARQQDDAELYRGARLSAALDWTTHHTSELNETEREFITASRGASQSELNRQQRQNRRLRGLLAGVIGVLVLALVAGSVALVQRRSAQRAAREALGRQLGAEAVSAPRLDEAMLLAREAVLLDNSPQTAGTLLATMLRSPALRGTFTLPIAFRPQNLGLSPDGRTLAERDNGDHLRFFDTQTHRRLPTVLNGYGFNSPLYAGNHMFAIKYDGPAPSLSVFDASTLKQQQTLQLGQKWITSPTNANEPMFANHDGSTVYFAWAIVDPSNHADRAAYINRWDVATGAHRMVKLTGIGVNAAALLPDGRIRVVTDDAVLTVDATTLRTVDRRPMKIGPGFAAMSADGRTLALTHNGPDGAPGETFTLVDLATGRRIAAGGSHTASIQNMAFTPDGRTVVTTGDDGNVDVWNAQTGALEQTLAGHSGRVLGLTISADGKTAYTAGLDGAIFAWDLGNSHRFGRSVRVAAGDAQNQANAPTLAVAPDGSAFATRSAAGKVGLFSLRTLSPTKTFAIGRGLDPTSLAWSKRGVVAVALADGGVQLWNPTGTPRLLRTLTGVKGGTRAVAFSPDGRRVAAVTAVQLPPSSQQPPPGWLAVWDVDTGRLLGSDSLGFSGASVVFSRDGRRLASGMDDGHIALTTASAKPQGRIDDSAISNGTITSMAFGADGSLATGTWSGIVQHWNISTRKQVGRSVLTEPAPVAALALAPDGSHFATTGGSSGALKIWDDTSLQQFGASFPGGEGVWQNAAYTPDGSSIVTVSENGQAAVWPVSVSAWMQHACSVAGRNFTHEEWSRFVPGHSYARTCPSFPAG